MVIALGPWGKGKVEPDEVGQRQGPWCLRTLMSKTRAGCKTYSDKVKWLKGLSCGAGCIASTFAQESKTF